MEMHPPQSSNAVFVVNNNAAWTGDNVKSGPNHSAWIGDFPPSLPYGPVQPNITIQPFPQKLLYPNTAFPWLPGIPDASPQPSIDRALDFYSRQTNTTTLPARSAWRVSYAGDKITAAVDVPGVKLEDLEVVIENSIIKVTGKRFDNGQVVSLTQVIGNDYDPKSSVADLEAGVLTVVVKKFEDKVVHKVNIKGK